MDVYIFTEDWNELVRQLARVAEPLGFGWCGQQAGWPEDVLFCLREGAELELVRSGTEMLDSMLPTTRCLVSNQDSEEDGALDAAAQGDGAVEATRVHIHLELPCPYDARRFSGLVWKGRPKLFSCLPLPTNLNETHRAGGAADVPFLWARAQALHDAGYASMMPYFETCHGHPFAKVARQLAH